MTVKEIQELIKLINKLNLSEFKMKDGEFELSVRTKHYEKGAKKSTTVVSPPPQQVIPVPSVPQTFPQQANTTTPPPPEPASAKEKPASEPAGDESKAYKEIKSPIVGTFYRSSSPDKPPYVKVGDAVEVGQVVCIVEAMKLFNEIESEIAGKVVKVMVEDAQPVEYDQVLFLVDPNG